MEQKKSKGCVLLVEDNDEMRRFLVSILRADGYETAEATSASEGVNYIYDSWGMDGGPVRRLDLIVSDVRMPGGLNGIDLLDVVCRAHTGTPVLLMTAFGAPETHQVAARLGAVAVLNKPFSVDEFRATVAAIVQQDSTGACGL